MHHLRPWYQVGLLAGTFTLATLSAACGGASAPPSPRLATSEQAGVPAAQSGEVGTLRIVATDFGFEPRHLQIPAGRKVTLSFENKGAMVHDWMIANTQLHLTAKPGQVGTGEIMLDRPGDYDVVCSIPYHTDFGMKGSVKAVGNPNAPVQSLDEPPTSIFPAIPAGTRRLPLPAVAPPLTRGAPADVDVEIETQEVTALVNDTVATTFWTFGGTVPGPMVRVRQGDTVHLKLKNAITSKDTHSIDFHAATGPGGGGKDTQIAPGATAEVSFKALNPGVYVYHCATPKIAAHIANGMYGMIVVEPQGGLPKVDHEFYAMQGELYLKGDRAATGLREFSWDKLLDERPDFVVMNGAVAAVAGDNAFKAQVGQTVRVFFGVGGPNVTSSFHIIGEIFDRVFPEGASEPLSNVQTTMVPAGGATMVELKLDAPGAFPLVDHSLGRLEKGAAALLQVEGAAQPATFQPGAKTEAAGDGHGGDGHAGMAM